MDHTQQFISFLLGKGEFPYGKNWEEVEVPKGFEGEHDCHISAEDGCEGHSKGL